MKKLILLMTVFFSCFGVKAQEATTDYVYSSDGFEVKTSVFTVSEQNRTYESVGLYSKDGTILVSAISGNYDDYRHGRRFYVIDGCETIASGAFQGVSNYYVFIPSSVKYIAPDALISRVDHSGGSTPYSYSNTFAGIQDGVKEQNASGAAYAPTADPNATEVARYNLQGVRLNEPTNGINIVQNSDGTADKEVVR